MNKTEFIKELGNELSYSIDKCTIINDTLENNFFISKKNRDKVINELSTNLDIDSDDATHIYDVAVKIINDEIKNKIKHPFGSNK